LEGFGRSIVNRRKPLRDYREVGKSYTRTMNFKAVVVLLMLETFEKYLKCGIRKFFEWCVKSFLGKSGTKNISNY